MLEVGFEHRHFGCVMPKSWVAPGLQPTCSCMRSQLWVGLKLDFYCCDTTTRTKRDLGRKEIPFSFQLLSIIQRSQGRI